jgi:hypothetical protein
MNYGFIYVTIILPEGENVKRSHSVFPKITVYDSMSHIYYSSFVLSFAPDNDVFFCTCLYILASQVSCYMYLTLGCIPFVRPEHSERVLPNEIQQTRTVFACATYIGSVMRTKNGGHSRMLLLWNPYIEYDLI